VAKVNEAPAAKLRQQLAADFPEMPLTLFFPAW